MPNSAIGRAEVVANVIKLHLNWEMDNLKHGVNGSASLNSFVEFAALFIPQIQGLAIAEYVGGEDTQNVRYGIATVVMNLLSWMLDVCVLMAEYHAPKYLSYRALGWYDEGLQALRAIDACLEVAFKNKIASFPEAKRLGSDTQMPGMFSRRIMKWANLQLVWANKMAEKLQSLAPMVLDEFGNLEEPFGRLRQTLDDHVRRGQAWQGRLM